MLVRASDEPMLLEEVCNVICRVAGYRMAWVGTVEHDADKSIRPVASGGAEEGYLVNARITWADTERGRGPTGMAVRTGKTHFFQDIAKEPAAAPWRDAALARDYRSSIALPLADNTGKVFAVFTLYDGQPNGFTPDEVGLLEQLAGDVAYGIGVLRTRVERDKAEKDLGLKNELIRITGDLAKVGGFEFDAHTRKGTWTDQVARIHEVEPGTATDIEFGSSFYIGESRQK